MINLYAPEHEFNRDVRPWVFLLVFYPISNEPFGVGDGPSWPDLIDNFRARLKCIYSSGAI